MNKIWTLSLGSGKNLIALDMKPNTADIQLYL